MLGHHALAKAVLWAITSPKTSHYKTPVAEVHWWLRRVGRNEREFIVMVPSNHTITKETREKTRLGS